MVFFNVGFEVSYGFVMFVDVGGMEGQKGVIC